MQASATKREWFSNSNNDDQILSPAPNRAKLLSENKGVMLSARTENYRAPQLRALDDKLKNIITEKKNRLMKKARSPLKQVSSNQNNATEVREQADVYTTHLNNENQFLKKKMKEMQRIITEMTQNQSKNTHLEYLKREIESKNQTISNLESKLFHSGLDQSVTSSTLEKKPRDEQKQKLKDVIEGEVKSLCTGLVQKIKENTLTKSENYMHHMLDSKDRDTGSLNTLLIHDRINQHTNMHQWGKDLQKLSQKIQLIFNTLLSIANNFEESSLEECLQKASDVVMSQITDIISSDQERSQKLVKFVQENDEEKLTLIKEKEELEILNKELDEKLLEATEELKNVYEKSSQCDQMEEEIDELNNCINTKDAQCQEMAEVIEHLEQIIEQEKQQNNELNQNLEDITQELEELKEEFDEKIKQFEELRDELEEKNKLLETLENEKLKFSDEYHKVSEEKDDECNKLYDELQNLIKINEELEDDVQSKDEVIQQHEDTIKELKETCKKIETLQNELTHEKISKDRAEQELERIKNEYFSLQNSIKGLQERLDSLGSDSKSELKEKDQKIEHLMNELSNYKDHMVKTLDLAKLSHSNDVKSLQKKIEQIESEKSQFYYELQATTKELEKLEQERKSTYENYKKELNDNYNKLQSIMMESSDRKEDAIKQSCKIVELMDDIREKDKQIDDKNDQISALQDKERNTNVELERARGVIKQLENNIAMWEKERAKEVKLRKEEQGRLLELIEDKQKLESKIYNQKERLEESSQQLDKLHHEITTLNEVISDLKSESQNLREDLAEKSEIAAAKSETIKDYERRLETCNEKLSEKQKVIEQLELQIDNLRNEIYEHKNIILEKTNDIKFINNKLKELSMRQENEQQLVENTTKEYAESNSKLKSLLNEKDKGKGFIIDISRHFTYLLYYL